MGRITFAQSLVDARLMADASKAHATELATVSFNADSPAELETLVNEMSILDTKQEKLKADLKACTAELDSKAKRLLLVMQDCKKRVKLALPHEAWKEFGIVDKK